MKRFISISLLIVFLFNVGGYYVLYLVLQYENYNRVLSRIDSDSYYEVETVEFKVPLAMPYPFHEATYTRATGEFEHNGEFYIVAGQKIANDTLYIKCVKNAKQRHLADAFRNFAKVSTTKTGKHSDVPNLLIKILKEYKSNDVPDVIRQKGWLRSLSYSTRSDLFSEEPVRVFFHPPTNIL